jgi:hypothetical protein
METSFILKAAQSSGIAHNAGAGGEYILVATERQLQTFAERLAAAAAPQEGAARSEGNVRVLQLVTSLSIPVERVLHSALEAAPDLASVVLIAEPKEGDLWVASSYADGGAVLWDMERAKVRLLQVTGVLP